MTENERKTMMNLADTIQGEINRMCVTKELSEFDTMYGHAKKNLEKLSKMIYDARFRAERRTDEQTGPNCGAKMRDENDEIPDDIPMEYFENGGV